MSTLDGLPAHILLNHFVVVLMPVTALLAILCAVWPAVRQRMVWLVLALAAVSARHTPVTDRAGDWLKDHPDQTSQMMDHHAELGETMAYFAAALLVAAILLTVLHVRQQRQLKTTPLLHALIVVLVIAASTASMVQVYRTGESGARATWEGFMSSISG